MATVYELTSETATAAITYQGWESVVFVSGEFDGGRMVMEFSPDEVTWFADRNLSFSFKGFETFKIAPSVRYRFRMESTDNGTPSVVVKVA